MRHPYGTIRPQAGDVPHADGRSTPDTITREPTVLLSTFCSRSPGSASAGSSSGRSSTSCSAWATRPLRPVLDQRWQVLWEEVPMTGEITFRAPVTVPAPDPDPGSRGADGPGRCRIAADGRRGAPGGNRDGPRPGAAGRRPRSPARRPARRRGGPAHRGARCRRRRGDRASPPRGRSAPAARRAAPASPGAQPVAGAGGRRRRRSRRRRERREAGRGDPRGRDARGGSPFLVRWSDGRLSYLYPGPDARIHHYGEPVGSTR
ncbi:conserved hypothetical protein [Frankia sp. Hr75.2]|nr:conserved hypothetical protein [Frankia sp. Hr75.2]